MSLFSITARSDTAPPAAEVFKPHTKLINPNSFELNWTIKPGFFLYADRVNISESEGSNVELNVFQSPKAIDKTDKQGQAFPVYRTKAIFSIAVLAKQAGESLAKLHYQGCSDEGFCYPPEELELKLSVNTQNELIDVSIEPKQSKVNDERLDTTATSAEETVFDHSLIVIILSFFGFGLLLSFTPCVLPMLPVLSGIIVGHGHNITTRKAFLLSLSYVLSMAATYAVVGALVAVLGRNLQIMMQSAWSVGFFSLVFVALALSMFGFYELKLPTSWQARLAAITKSQTSGHYLSAGIMGSLSTLILSPCVTAPLIAALAYIANSGNLALGSLALFFLGLGMGTPLLLIGASAGKLLPKAGHWMNAVKTFFGLIMLAAAIYLLDRIIPSALTMFLWAVLFIFAGIYYGAADLSGTVPRFRQSLGIIALAQGILILIGTSMGSTSPVFPLAPLAANHQTKINNLVKADAIQSLTALKSRLLKLEGKAIILDFYADWCRSCKLMETTTFKDKRVQKALRKIVMLKADITKNNSSQQQLLHHFNVVAPPTFLFFNAQGKEIESLRITGEISSEDLIKRLKKFKRLLKRQ